MVEYKVLITTSGVGSRLGELTDNTNKCLVRITDKPSISYIIESYPKNTNFVITLGYFGDYVKQYLTLTYPTYNFTFINIDNYDGEGSSLGYSILQCKGELQCPFIFHASDTIITNTELPPLTDNWLVGSHKEDSSHYGSLMVKGGEITKINEKGEINYDSLYVGLSGIKDYELFFKHLEILINGSDNELSDVHVVIKMLEETNFKHIKVDGDNWFDIGNVNELNRTRDSFESNIEVLDKSEESIFFFDDFIIKFFADSKINNQRVVRANILGWITPTIIDSTDNFYKYEKVEGSLFSKSVNADKFHKFLDWSQNNLWVEKSTKDFNNKCYDFYVNKTKKRIKQYLNSDNDKSEMINGYLVPSIYDMLDEIDFDWLCNGLPSQFHGDFILDNIIETEDGFSLIDWRQNFGGDLEVGDLYYDLAKLNHNLTVNHDIINRGLFNQSKGDCYILVNSKLNECRGILHEFIKDNGYDLRKVNILTAIIWLNMSPLHDYPFNDFLFTFGKYTLYSKLKE